MKINLMFALAAVLAFAPVADVVAADAKAGDEAAEASGPTPAQLKARKAKKFNYTKFKEGKLNAEKCDLPHVVAILPAGNPSVAFFKQKIFNRKEFLKDFAAKNCVITIMTVKQDSKNKKKIDTKSMKEEELTFLQNFMVTKAEQTRAKQLQKDPPVYNDLAIYPKIIVLNSTSQSELFKFPKFDSAGGFGVWLSQVADCFRQAGIEPELSPIVTKIVENPDEPKKWK